MMIVEIAFCYAVFPVTPSFGQVSKHVLVESLSLKKIILSGSVSQEINKAVCWKHIDWQPFQSKQTIVST